MRKRDAAAEIKKILARWEYWRQQGVAVGDAPLDYRTGEDLDKYTDEAIAANRGRKDKK